MYKRLSAVMFPIVLLALIGAGVWGYQENKEKNTILIKAENQYQRAFHDLSNEMDRLHTEIGNTLAVNSTSQLYYRKGLINIWRLTSQAQNDIGQLPLTLMPFNKTQEFLDHVSKFAYNTSVRDFTAKPMSQDELATLTSLYERSKEINGELGKVQNQVLAKNLRWMDVEVALASQKENVDNVIIDGLRAVDKKVGGYTDINWGPSSTGSVRNKNFSILSGNDVSAEDVKKKAAQFLGHPDPSRLTVVEDGKGTDANMYTVTGPKDGTNDPVQIDYTKKGGNLLMYLASRSVGEKNLDVRGARDAAQEFLNNHGYTDMTPVAYDEYNNTGSLTFARRANGVIVYPEKLTVNVALDNGDVIGLQASDYVLEHKNRADSKPKVTVEQAKKELNPKFALMDTERAIIRNDMNEETECYQFMGKLNGSTYKVYVNAETGLEEKIETLRSQDVQAAR